MTNSTDSIVLVPLLIDMQSLILKHVPEYEQTKIIDNQIGVLGACSLMDVPLVVLELNPHLLGETIESLKYQVKQVPRHIYVRRRYNDSFRDTDLDHQLKQFLATHLLLMGINASYCVKETAMSALERDYNIVTSEGLIGDATYRRKYGSMLWFMSNGICIDKNHLRDYTRFLEMLIYGQMG